MHLKPVSVQRDLKKIVFRIDLFKFRYQKIFVNVYINVENLLQVVHVLVHANAIVDVKYLQFK